MRIAVLTNAYPPETRGGAGQIAFLQVEALRAAGHEVRVWSSSLAWTERSLFIRAWYHLRDHLLIHPCVTEIRAWNPDRFVSHNLTGVGFRTPRAIQAHGVPWIHVLHDVQLFSPSGRLYAWEPITMFQRFWAKLRRAALGTPDVILSPTQTLLRAHEIRGLFSATKTIVLPNPAPVSLHLTRTRHIPLRVAFVGRWSQEKGSSLLTALFQDPELASFEWHVVGPGTERIHPPGGQGHGSCSVERILHLLGEVDVLLVPSQICENQPTVILEAMSRGLPIIASDQAGIRETLDGAGVLCDTHDPTVWKYALLECLKESENRYQKRVAEMERAYVRYEPRGIAQRFAEVLVTLN